MISRTRNNKQTQQDGAEGKTAETSACPECDAGRVINDGTERICESCGLVVDEDIVDRGPEWRSYSGKEWDEKSRVGSPVSNQYHDKGLSTQIGSSNRDSNGNSLSARKRMRMNRLRQWNSRMQKASSTERNQQKGLGEIQRMASALGLPNDTRETAGVLYRVAVEDGLLMGRSIEEVATASLYAAARQTGHPRTLSEFDQVSRVSEQEIGRGYRYLSDEMGLKIAPEDPEKYIPRFVSDAVQDVDRHFSPELVQDIENVARDFVDVARKDNILSGRDPSSIAVAAIYLAGKTLDVNITQRNLANKCNVSPVTIRNRYQQIAETSKTSAK